MRAKEFINEAQRGTAEENFAASNPGAVVPTGTDNLYASRYYDFYRISTLTGLSKEQLAKTDAVSYIGNMPMYNSYTEEEHEKLINALQKLGLNPSDFIPRHSKEIDGINSVSPVLPKKKNKYGV